MWLCEAARVPVVWATQVLGGAGRRGSPVRGEFTDAAMAERAECVMLNKGPYLVEAVPFLADVLPPDGSPPGEESRRVWARYTPGRWRRLALDAGSAPRTARASR